MVPVKSKVNRLSRLGLAYTVLLIVVNFVQYAIHFAIEALAPELLSHPLYITLLSVIPLYAIGLPTCILILPKPDKKNVSGVKLSFLELSFAAIICFGLALIGNLVGNTAMIAISAIKGEMIANPLQSIVLDSNILITFVLTVIIAPIGEEFIFRRLIIDRIKPYGELPAILLSAAMFAAFHLNLYQFFYAFLLGLVFGYIYVKTGRLSYTVILHAIINFCGGVFVAAALDATMSLTAEGASPSTLQTIISSIGLSLILQYVGFLFCAALATIILACVFLRKLNFIPGENSLNIPRSPFVIVFFVLCLTITVADIII